MPSTLLVRSFRVVLLLRCIAVFAGTVSAADLKPLTKEEQDKINNAIDRGVQFLKGAQANNGGWKWRMYRDGRFQAAQSALPAYALLEAGVAANDPVIQKAAEYVRPKALTSDFTYELSLTLLFLDRLGDPKDEKLIKTLAARLVAGQHFSGGWSYRCPTLDDQTEQNLLRFLEPVGKKMKRGQTREQALGGMELPAVLQTLTVFRPAVALEVREPPAFKETIADSAVRFSTVGRTDNSNTQFVMLALWAAQRHGLPIEPTFEIMTARFERSHAYPSGLWNYAIDEDGGSRSMICVGLMGLAIGRGLQLVTPGAALPANKDVHVLKGFAALSPRVGRPTGRMDKFVPFYDLYYLWSLERVAMLYDLQLIGGKDWYRWGAESLVGNQTPGGWWTGMSPLTEWAGRRNYDYRASLSTAFALLFLKRAHPMKDLTPKLALTGAKLNESISALRPGDKYPIRALATSGPSRDREP
jgi:hypothetical protein